MIDTSLEDCCSLIPAEIRSGLELYLNPANFTFKHPAPRRSEGIAIVSPISPVSANPYLQFVESNALASFRNAPRIYLKYVDDTFFIMKSRYTEDFLRCLNSQCDSISVDGNWKDTTFPRLLSESEWYTDLQHKYRQEIHAFRQVSKFSLDPSAEQKMERSFGR